MKSNTVLFLLATLCCSVLTTDAFMPPSDVVTRRASTSQFTNTAQFVASEKTADDEYVAKRIFVKGDVGGYYRSCVLNEAGKFRRLVGTMSPPDDTDKAEIYVEGKSKMVEGFVRWLKRGKVGLSQVVGVEEVRDEEPTGLYDDFYCKTH